MVSALLLFSALATALPPGFDHFYNLDYEEALADFERQAAAHPDDPDYRNYIAQAVLFREMFRVGALDSELVSGNNPFLRRPKMKTAPEVDRRFRDSISQAMRLAQQRLNKNPKDTGAMYALGVAYGLRANFNYLVTKAWMDALRDATAGRKLHNRVTELDPANHDARLMQGIHDYVVGSLPVIYKMLGFLVGFRGDREKGIRTLEAVAQKGARNRIDAEILLCALYRRERHPAKALPLIEDLIRRFPRNYLLRFEQAQMYSDAGDGRKALASVDTIAQLKHRRAPGYDRVSWQRIWYQAGTIQFWYGDLENALGNMEKVTAGIEEVDLNTGVLAWMRIGQIYDLKGRRDLAAPAYKQAIQLAPQADAARESRRYLSSPYQRRTVRN